MNLSPFLRDERTWAIAIRPFYANQKFRTEFPYFSWQKRPEFRRKRDLYEPLLTAMAQVLPFLSFHPQNGFLETVHWMIVKVRLDSNRKVTRL